VTVIATDKTGTPTEGRVVAERVWTPPLQALLGTEPVTGGLLLVAAAAAALPGLVLTLVVRGERSRRLRPADA
jgi:hypothetical protein